MLDEDRLFDLIRQLPGKKSKYEIAAAKELANVSEKCVVICDTQCSLMVIHVV